MVYASVNYAERDTFAQGWTPYRYHNGDQEWWDGEAWTSDSLASPLPNYEELVAYAPFADVDLVEDVKPTRPGGGVPEDVVEDAIAEYVAAFADLAGGRDAVFALDSVGGFYVLVAPGVTAPIGEHYAAEPEKRGAIFDELTDRLNEWLERVAENARAAVPEAEGVLDPDYINHKNRLFKAPLSLHCGLDGAVTPIDPADPDYTYTPIEAADDALLAEAEAWTDAYTADYADRVSALVGELWPGYMNAAETWTDALDAWYDAEKARDPAPEGGSGGSNPGESGGGSGVGTGSAGGTSNFDAVREALDALDYEAVAEATIVAEWNESANTSGSARAFYPTWDPNCNGTANIINVDTGLWTDTGSGDQGGPVEWALIAEQGWRCGRWASGADWVEGLRELQRLGFDVPIYESDQDDDDRSPYYDVDLVEYAGPRDVFDDPEALLLACLRARESGEHPELNGAKPPYKALVAVAEQVGLSFKDPEERILGKDSHRLARDVFDELDPEVL